MASAVSAWAGGHGGEEVLGVEAQHHPAARVRGGVRAGGAAAAEAVCGLVRWDGVEDRPEDPPLHRLEAGLRALDDPRRPGRAGKPEVRVVAQRLGLGPPLEAAGVGQPRELAEAELEEDGEIGHGVELGHGPGPPVGHGRLPHEPAAHVGRVRLVALALEHDRDESGELARAVGGRAVVVLGHDPDYPPQPAWPGAQRLGPPGDQAGLVPRPGEEGGGQRRPERPPRPRVVHAAQPDGRRRRLTGPVVRAPGCAVRIPGVTPERLARPGGRATPTRASALAEPTLLPVVPRRAATAAQAVRTARAARRVP